MKETFYFSHDYNANRDPKIIKLLNKFNWSGYGMYWRIIEILHEQEGKILIDDFADMLMFELRIDEKTCKQFTDFLISIKLLFVSDDGKFITSNRVLKNLAYKQQRKEILTENGKKGGRPKSNTKPNDNQTETKTKPIGFENETKNNQIKLNKIKLNKIKENEIKESNQSKESEKTDCLTEFLFTFDCKDKKTGLTKKEVDELIIKFPKINVPSYLVSFSNYCNSGGEKIPLAANLKAVIEKTLNKKNSESEKDDYEQRSPYKQYKVLN